MVGPGKNCKRFVFWAMLFHMYATVRNSLAIMSYFALSMAQGSWSIKGVFKGDTGKGQVKNLYIFSTAPDGWFDGIGNIMSLT